MNFVLWFLLFLLVALFASFLGMPGLEFLASDAARWVLVIGIIVLLARAILSGTR